MAIGIVGIDCAAQVKNIGLAFGSFENGIARIDQVSMVSDRANLVGMIVDWTEHYETTLLALDAPLGWPWQLGKTLNTHQAGETVDIHPNILFRRETDRFIKKIIGKQSLDVGADRIARTAHAALSLLDEIRKVTGRAIPLAWEPIQFPGVYAIEIYPAATLLVHSIRFPSYKGEKGWDVRSTIIKRIQTKITTPTDTSLMQSNDNALDAALCILAGVDFLLGDAMEPVDMHTAKREGWMWVRKPG